MGCMSDCMMEIDVAGPNNTTRRRKLEIIQTGLECHSDFDCEGKKKVRFCAVQMCHQRL